MAGTTPEGTNERVGKGGGEKIISKLFLALTFRKTKSHILFVIGKAMYQKWVIDDVRHLLHILKDLPSCRPPVDHLLELLPRYTRVSTLM